MQTLERQSVAPVHPRSRRPAPSPLEFYRSSVGKKWVMALSGIVLLGYVFAHMIGNLKMFLGAEDINHYGEWLRELLVPILPRTVPCGCCASASSSRSSSTSTPRHALTLDEPPGPVRGRYVSPATTSPPTSPAARCAGPASSSACS